MQKAIKDEIEKQVMVLNTCFDDSSIPIGDRPHMAFTYIYNNMIKAPNEQVKKDALIVLYEKLYPVIYDWYSSRYGEEAFQTNFHVKSFTIISGIPYLLKIPTTVKIKNADPKLFDVYFLRGIKSFENILDYIENNKILDSLNEKEKLKIRKDIEEKIIKLRSIGNTLLTFNGNKVSIRNCELALNHMSIAVEDILKNYGKGVSLAIWEMFFTCELIIKEYLRMQNIEYKHIHDLRQLAKLIDDVDINQHCFLLKYPNWHDCVNYRHGNLIISELHKINEYYEMTIEFIETISRKFPSYGITNLECITMKNIFEQ